MQSLRILIILVLLFSSFASLQSEDVIPILKVGFTEVFIPTPIGFVRYDGLNSKVDALTEKCTPPMNLHLASYCSSEDLSVVRRGYSPNGLEFCIESSRFCERKDVTPAVFESAIDSVRNKMENQESFAKTIDQSDQLLSGKFKATVKSDVPVYISCFAKSSIAYGYTIIMSQSISEPTIGNRSSNLMLQSILMLYLKNKVFYLSTIQPYQTKSDITESQNLITEWKEQILKANY